MSTPFAIRGFPASSEVPETTEESTVTPSPKKRGPYKKKAKEVNNVASMTPMEKIMFALKDVKDGPSEVTLHEWKDRHGMFYMSSVDGVNIYLWKTIKRSEYKQMLINVPADKPGALEEFVVRRSLLWPKADIDFMSKSDAGVISTLFKQIYYKSGFISDEEAMTMIERI